MNRVQDITRRHFLRTGLLAGGAVVAGSTVPSGALLPELGAFSQKPLRVIPLIKRYGSHTAIVQLLPFKPLAYFSKPDATLYLDPARRTQVARALNARIGNGQWTFAAADGLGEETARERPLQAMDLQHIHAPGDCRVVDRAPVPVRWDLSHARIHDARPAVWLNSRPLKHAQCVGPHVGPQAAPHREDYRLVGLFDQFADDHCTRPAGQARLFNWVAAPAAAHLPLIG